MAKEFELDEDQVLIYEEMEKAVAIAKKLFSTDKPNADMAMWVYDLLFVFTSEDEDEDDEKDES